MMLAPSGAGNWPWRVACVADGVVTCRLCLQIPSSSSASGYQDRQKVVTTSTNLLKVRINLAPPSKV